MGASKFVYVHWQQGTCQAWVNYFIRWMPALNWWPQNLRGLACWLQQWVVEGALPPPTALASMLILDHDQSIKNGLALALSSQQVTTASQLWAWMILHLALACISFLFGQDFENMSVCTGSSVNANYEHIASWAECHIWTGISGVDYIGYTAFHKQIFQWPTLSQCWEMIENANIYF